MSQSFASKERIKPTRKRHISSTSISQVLVICTSFHISTSHIYKSLCCSLGWQRLWRRNGIKFNIKRQLYSWKCWNECQESNSSEGSYIFAHFSLITVVKSTNGVCKGLQTSSQTKKITIKNFQCISLKIFFSTTQLCLKNYFCFI